MGTSESMLSGSQRPADEITTVSERPEGVDPVLEKLRSLETTPPILTSLPSESSLTDILEAALFVGSRDSKSEGATRAILDVMRLP